jgi:pantothenate kinase-related protein Tda10
MRWLLLGCRMAARGGASPRQSQRQCQVIGINAPQGAGKTTLVNSFRDLFRRDGLSSVVLSIDDFYLTRGEQQVWCGVVWCGAMWCVCVGGGDRGDSA